MLTDILLFFLIVFFSVTITAIIVFAYEATGNKRKEKKVRNKE